jgi:hypothetical protein
MGLDTKQGHEISLFSKEPKPTLWSIKAPYSINNVGALSLRVKQPGCEDHSQLVPNLRTGRPIPPLPCLNYMCRDDFTVTLKSNLQARQISSIVIIFLQSSEIKYQNT